MSAEQTPIANIAIKIPMLPQHSLSIEVVGRGAPRLAGAVSLMARRDG